MVQGIALLVFAIKSDDLTFQTRNLLFEETYKTTSIETTQFISDGYRTTQTSLKQGKFKFSFELRGKTGKITPETTFKLNLGSFDFEKAISADMKYKGGDSCVVLRNLQTQNKSQLILATVNLRWRGDKVYVNVEGTPRADEYCLASEFANYDLPEFSALATLSGAFNGRTFNAPLEIMGTYQRFDKTKTSEKNLVVLENVDEVNLTGKG